MNDTIWGGIITFAGIERTLSISYFNMTRYDVSLREETLTVSTDGKSIQEYKKAKRETLMATWQLNN